MFEDLLYQNVNARSAARPRRTRSRRRACTLGTGVRVVATEKIYTQGNLQQTDNALDVAIEGRGFFQIQLPDGTLGYTRDGSFQVNAQGELVTSSGYACSRASRIPDGAQIGHDRRATASSPRSVAGQAAPMQVGTLQLADFINPAGLQPRGENLLVESAASGPPQTGTPGLNGLGTDRSRARSRAPTSTSSKSW